MKPIVKMILVFLLVTVCFFGCGSGNNPNIKAVIVSNHVQMKSNDNDTVYETVCYSRRASLEQEVERDIYNRISQGYIMHSAVYPRSIGIFIVTWRK